MSCLKGSDEGDYSSSSSEHVRQELTENKRKRLREVSAEVPKKSSKLAKKVVKKSAQLKLAALGLGRGRRRGVGRRILPMKTVSLMDMGKSEYTALRWDKNPYEGPRDVDRGGMFRTNIQKKIYEEVILALDTKIGPQKAIDFEYIKRFGNIFVNVFETCHRLGLVDIMEFRNNYNEKVVMQFYATMFLEKDVDRHFRWMTNDTDYRAHLVHLLKL